MNVIELIGTILIFVVIIAILILAFIPSKCPKCGGKMKDVQKKEIDLYSQQTISAKMKSARERNLCETTEELMAKYAKEKENG